MGVNAELDEQEEAETAPVVEGALVPFRRKRSVGEYAGLLGRGFAMGTADVVPGVSGGTMAFILGIYEELIDSIRTVGRKEFLQPLFTLRWKIAFQVLNWPFLVAVLAGIGLAVLSFARILEWLLLNQPVYVWSFFFGLVLASVFAVKKRIKRWNATLLALLVAGTIAAFYLVGIVPVETPNDWWFLFFSGALAICAMILPGISGAFILLILGKYQYILTAVNDRDIMPIALVGAGAVVGLVSFAQVLGWLFKRYHDPTVALLIGLMLGSLRKVWPWKETLASITGSHGEEVPTVVHNVLPSLVVGGRMDWTVIIAILLAVVGFVGVLLLERFSDVTEEQH